VAEILSILTGLCNLTESGYYNSMAKHESEKPAQSLDEIVKQAADDDKEDKTPPETVGNAISAETLATLDTMNAEQLRGLILSVAGAIWGYAMMDDDQKAEAARLKLYNLGMSATEVHKVVPALDKWFDRTQGKAPQSIALDVKDTRMDKMPIDRLLRLAAMLDEPVIIAPLPTTIDQ